MVSTYILILCLSAALAAFTALRMAGRLASMSAAAAPPAGLFVALSAIGFLIIVTLPSLVVAGSLLMLALFALGPRLGATGVTYLSVPLVAAVLGITSLPLAGLFTAVPDWLGYALAVACWAVLSVAGGWLPATPVQGHGAVLALLLPLAAAPFYSSAPDYLSLDAALLIAPLIGADIAARRLIALDALYFAPTVYVAGWMMLQCLSHHSFTAPALSLAALVVALLLRFLQPSPPMPHAPAL